MSNQTTTGGGFRATCSECESVLVPSKNWTIHNIKTGITICKQCDRQRRKNTTFKRRTEETAESKLERMKTKLIDEERIKRMTEWIQEYNVQYWTEKHIIDTAKRHPSEAAVYKQAAEEETRSWTWEDVKDRKRRDIEVLTKILITKGIEDPKEGDTAATWHIAFHECGYKGYELDEHGLPLTRPGILKFASFTRKRKSADTIYAGKEGRIGIVSVPYLDSERGRPTTEYRIIILKSKKIFDELDEKRRLRHSKENEKMAKLRIAMNLSLAEQGNVIDALVGIYTAT